jgi:hypothetical protein
MASRLTPAPESTTNLDALDDEHRKVLNRAVRNVLNTEVAELAYAQILDGLPNEKSLRDSFGYVKDHPVHNIQHTEICPGYVEKARKFRSQFDLSQLQLSFKVHLQLGECIT